MSLKCVLVNPVQLVNPPIGLLYVAASLESKGYDVRVRELPSPFIVDYERSLHALIQYLNEAKPAMIGITCMAAQRSEVATIVKAVKDHGICSKVVVGGVHASFMPEEVMRWGTDYAVTDEGEETIIEIMELLEGKRSVKDVKGIFYIEDGRIRSNEKRPLARDLDNIPFPAYHLIDKVRFTTRKGIIRGRWSRGAWIMTSRGCPSSCVFCAAHRMFGRQVRYRSIGKIFEEIESLVKNYGIDTLVFLDDTFTVRKEYVSEFCRNIKSRFPEIRWSCQARVNLFDDEFAKMLHDSNCIQVDFGVESGSQRILDRLKKGIKVENTIKAFESCKRVGLRTLATVMVGNPGEDISDLEMTRLLLKKIKPDFSAAYYTTPFPGTELYEDAVRKNLIDTRERFWHQYTEPVKMSNVDSKILKKYLREFTRLNIFKNYLANFVFLWDMVCFSFCNPMLAFKATGNLLAGRIERVLFIITNSMYFKKQV